MARLSTTPFWRESLRDGPQQVPPVTFRPRQVFVLMQMTSGDSEAVYRAIKAGCRTVDLVATRVDEKPGATVIMRDIDAMMGHAEFLVFDLSNERPNVYYELGYAHGIGNHPDNILLVAREGTRIHFDVAPLRVHFYRSLEHLESLVAAQLGELKRTTRHSAAASSSPSKVTRPWWKFW